MKKHPATRHAKAPKSKVKDLSPHRAAKVTGGGKKADPSAGNVAAKWSVTQGAVA